MAGGDHRCGAALTHQHVAEHDRSDGGGVDRGFVLVVVVGDAQDRGRVPDQERRAAGRQRNLRVRRRSRHGWSEDDGVEPLFGKKPGNGSRTILVLDQGRSQDLEGLIEDRRRALGVSVHARREVRRHLGIEELEADRHQRDPRSRRFHHDVARPPAWCSESTAIV